ncbi:MAG: NAD(P)-dependent oxidoreductase [Ruminococcaceae bacterium]|nr:NAD(P)-dependent oxidoreductase [Oscillospiraceae bacterium]
MRVAITGASGFLGRHLVRELLASGDEPLILGIEKEGTVCGLPIVTTDYTADALKEQLKGADAVVHLASTRGVFPRLSAYYDCVEMTENVYEAAVACGIQNVVYASSISVYAGDELPYVETQAPAPGNLYGVYKLTCEQFCQIYGVRDGLRIKNLRFAHLYGANEQNNYMINVFFRRAFAHEPLQVFSQNPARRQMLYVKDAARAICAAIRKPDVSGTFNIASNDALTNGEIAETICRVFTPDLQVQYGDKVECTPSSYMDGTKAREQLDFLPKYSFEEAVKEIYADMLSVARSES